MIPEEALAFDDFTGADVAEGIELAWAFAAADPYRAATHNKGIMNGIDAVVLATGNDWRAIEAGAHAYAARDGRYTSLSTWERDGDGQPGGHAGDADGGGHRRRRDPRPSDRPGGAQDAGRQALPASWPRSSSASAWRRTWRPSARWPPRASSGGT